MERLQREAEAEKAQRDVEAKEAQRTVEVEEVQRKAEEEESARKEAKKQKKAKASLAWHKQLELLSQCKVAAWITQEEDAQSMLEAGGEASQSRIMGYGKGKVLEKHICMNCLRKGVKCEWNKGGQGESEELLFFI